LGKWANLLGNTTDKEVIMVQLRKIFIDTLESLRTTDLKIFDDINKFCITAE
jgi:hypothetical protein